jgi:hypothetical protein
MDEDGFKELHVGIKAFIERNCPGAKYIFSLERCPTSNRLHYQGHIKLATKVRPVQFAALIRPCMPGVHVSADSTIGSRNAEFYCFDINKPSFVSGPYADGSFEMPYMGEDLIRIEDFRDWQAELYNILEGVPDRSKIIWIYNARGGCGKSSFTKWYCFHRKVVALRAANAGDLLNLVYKSKAQRVYLVDVSRSIGKQYSMDDLYQALEDIKNGRIVNTKYETGQKLFSIPHVVVFSNMRPDLEKLSGYKWSVYEVNDANTLRLIH